jgi:TIR domain
VWRDTADLWPGEDWRSKIRQAIVQNALVFIACFSTRGIAREKSYQYEELLLAVDQMRLRRPDTPWLIPVRLDDCEIPDVDIGGGRTLGVIQRVDLFGVKREAEISRLISVILRLLGNKNDSPAVGPTAEVRADEYHGRKHEADERHQTEERQAAEQHRAQAEKVFIVEKRLEHNPAVSQAQRASGVASGPVIMATVRNSSERPVYDLALTWHRGSALWGEIEHRPSLMPGTDWSSTKALPDDLPKYVNPAVFGAVAWFRDATGNRWRTRPDGVLDEISPGQQLP